MSLKWNLCSCNTYRTYRTYHIQCRNINAAPHSRWWCVILQVWYYYLMRSSIFFIKMHFQHFFALQSRPFCGIFFGVYMFRNNTTNAKHSPRIQTGHCSLILFPFRQFSFCFLSFCLSLWLPKFPLLIRLLIRFFLLDANGFLYFSTNELAVWIYCTDFGDPPFWFSYIQS